MAQDATIYNWRLKRSGAAMRLEGFDAEGDPVKFTVTSVEWREGGPIAESIYDGTFRLSHAPHPTVPMVERR